MTLATTRKQAPDSTSKAKRAGARDAPPNPQRTRGSFPVPFIQRKPTCACGGGCPRCKEHSAQEGLEIGQLQDGYEREADHVAEQMIRMPEPQLQRACANHTMAGGECSGCRKKDRLGLRTKLKVNEPGDIYEREADRIADQVLATPARPAVNGTPPRIQRFAGQAAGQAEAAPASVDQVLVSPGRPLEPALRQDMEQRFGHDFSQVRVHTGAAAEQSAQDVNAHAYTVGHNMVFGAGRFAPGTNDGRRLIAHELTHVVQQSGVDRVHAGQTDKEPGVLYVARRTARAPVQTVPSARAPVQTVPSTVPYWQRRGDPGPGGPIPLPPPRRGRPPYPRPPQPGARLTSEEESRLPRPFIAIATFAPGQAVMQNVKWGGYARGFSKNGTTKLGASDPEKYTFAILEPPSSLKPGAYPVMDIDISRKATWDGYLIPVWSDLDAAWVKSLNRETDDVMLKGIPDQNIRYGNPIKGRPGNWFLGQFDDTAWVPIKNVQIKQMVPGEELELSPEKQEEKEIERFRELMVRSQPAIEEFQRRLKPPHLAEPTAAPDVLRFYPTGDEVTIGRLSVLAEERYPRGVEDPGLLKALMSSQEFSFSGSEDARAMAAVALVTELREARRRSRRRSRRRCKRATGPSCPIWQPRLTNPNEYWNRAYEYRRDQNMLARNDFNQNIAVLLLDGEKPIVRKNEMKFHSEQLILWELAEREPDSDCPILGLFSERKPCQEICQKQVLPQLCRVNNGVPFDVFFATDYYNSPGGMRSENNRHELIRSYAQAGYIGGF